MEFRNKKNNKLLSEQWPVKQDAMRHILEITVGDRGEKEIHASLKEPKKQDLEAKIQNIVL